MTSTARIGCIISESDGAMILITNNTERKPRPAQA